VCSSLAGCASEVEDSHAVVAPLAASERSQACVDPPPRDCSFYSACLEASHPCGEDGYALGYGERYCKRFLANDDLSPAGKEWRDATMRCLQVRLTRYLSAPRASCDEIIDGAFDDHPACYTQPGSSICALSPWDWLSIVSTIDLGDLVSSRGRRQIAQTAGTCLSGWLSDLTRGGAPDATSLSGSERRTERGAPAGARQRELRSLVALTEALAADPQTDARALRALTERAFAADEDARGDALRPR
jgi:hypothetical protein